MDTQSVYTYLQNSGKYNLESKVDLREFPKNSYIYLPGDKQTHIYLIEAGIVKIGSYNANGEEVIYDVLNPGETFGNLHYLDQTFFEFAKAMSGIRTVSFAVKFFREIIVHDPLLSEWFNITAVKRWSKAETRLFYMTRGNIENRIENLLKDLSQSVSDKDGQTVNAFQLLSQQDLADLTGTTRQTIAHKLKKKTE